MRNGNSYHTNVTYHQTLVVNFSTLVTIANEMLALLHLCTHTRTGKRERDEEVERKGREKYPNENITLNTHVQFPSINLTILTNTLIHARQFMLLVKSSL